jgi:hypothetical protein
MRNTITPAWPRVVDDDDDDDDNISPFGQLGRL